MFHYKDGLFFGRLADGSVRVLQLDPCATDWPKADEPRPDARFDVTIDPDGWASIIASVSRLGESDGRFFVAQKFHNDPGIKGTKIPMPE